MKMATEMRMVILGDLNLGSGPEYVWGNTLPLIRRADCVVANLKSEVADSDIKNMAVLKAAGVNRKSEWRVNHDVFKMVSLKENAWNGKAENIEKEARGCDWLIATIDWEDDRNDKPDPENIIFAHRLIDAGAKIVMGYSPHVCRGVEKYNDGLILYGVGDFLGDHNNDTEDNEFSMIFGVEGSKGEINKIYMYPTVFKDQQAKMAEGPEQGAIARRMIDLCAKLGTKVVWNSTRGRIDVL